MLPETLGRPLTTTLEEAEALGREPRKKKSHEDAEDGLEMNQHPVKAWDVLQSRETDEKSMGKGGGWLLGTDKVMSAI